MPINGYWIECVPVIDNDDAEHNNNVSLYNASLTAMPDIKVVATSPDQAIDKLRNKLRALNRYYRIKGQILPELENPLQPPRVKNSLRGWISVYVQMNDAVQ